MIVPGVLPTGKIIPKKRFAQHFLIDPHLQQRILKACDLHPQDTILEIGAGTGILTRAIAQCVRQVVAVEIDPKLFAILQKNVPFANACLINKDFLKFDFARIPPGTKVIGNLPYNLSTPIITRLIRNRRYFSEIFLTLQWEFARRLAAKPGTKEYGALSCFVQYYCEGKLLFPISPTCFRPIPKVRSGFVKLQFREPPYPVKSEELLFQVIQLGFQQRRKMAINALSANFPKEKVAGIFAALQLDGHLRSEDLSLRDFVDIANGILRMKMRGGN